MHQEKILISDSSIDNRENIDNVLQEIKTVLFDMGISKTIISRVYSVAVECLDNVLKHSAHNAGKKINTDYPPQFVLKKDNKNIMINTRNLIENNSLNDLSDSLDKVNLLKPEQLKQLYKSKLKSAEISEKGGAGLGLITIAKISRQKVKYRFGEVDENYSYFDLEITCNHIQH